MWLRALAATSVCLLLVAVACGDTYDSDAAAAATDAGVHTDAASPSGDASPRDASAKDAATFETIDAGPHCSHDTKFAKVEPVLGLPSQASWARFTPDEQWVYFMVGSDHQVRVAERGANGAYGLATAASLTEANATAPSISADRKLIFYEDYFAVFFQSGPAGGPYALKTSVAPLKPYGIGTPSFDEVHQRLFVDLHLDTTNYFGNTALAVAPMNGGSVGTFERVDVGFGLDGGLEHTDAAARPPYRFLAATPTVDGEALYFGSSVRENGPPADDDVWVATRKADGTGYEKPRRILEVASEYSELPTWISPDNCRLYFATNRTASDHYYADMWVATRSP